MKAIILAAGKGTRLGKYTENLPKGMLSFYNKSLIERQIETLKECGISDIIIVTGYMDEKIKFPEARYYHNPDFDSTNMVATLFCAEKEMDGEILVCYSDIIYEKEVLEKILESKSDVGVTADADYLDYWKARLENWKEDLESLQMNSEGYIFEIGTKTTDLEKTKARYVGLIKFSGGGVNELKRIFYKNKGLYWNSSEKWLNSSSFKKAYMTDMLQAMINEGIKIESIIIKRGWLEFDTEEDYEKAIKWGAEGSLGKYINLDKKLKIPITASYGDLHPVRALKKIAISQRVINSSIGANRDGLEQDYAKYYSKYGLILIPVPNVLENVEKYLLELKIDGIILSGGNDINPKIYGGISESGEIYSDERDSTEKKILDFAIEKKLPVFCECRGMQFLNVYFGGKLIKNLKNMYSNKIEHVGKNHEIEIIDDKIIQKLGRNRAIVNSYHNQGFSERELSDELQIFARASDGIIEGVKHKELPIIGIMWHPERPGCNEEFSKIIMDSFLGNFI